MLGLAFVIPAYKIFEDIKSRFGEEPLLCPSTSVIQRYSAPNDCKVAEQPLLDPIEGKGTVSIIQLRGFTACRRFTSIGYDREKFTKEIAISRLVRCAAYPTQKERLAGLLQAVLQHGGDAVCRGNILGTSVLLTGISNRLMPAAFSDTGYSAGPHSFASIVPGIGAYNNFGGDHEMTGEAAGGESSDLRNGILVWNVPPEKHSELTFNVSRVPVPQRNAT